MNWQDTIQKIMTGGFDKKGVNDVDKGSSNPQDSLGLDPKDLLNVKDKQIATLTQQV